jgi:hypothetical protein
MGACGQASDAQGGLGCRGVLHINERCAIVWMIFPFPACKIGKMPARGTLFEHMKEAPEPGR